MRSAILGRCRSPPSADMHSLTGSGRCKTILERRAAPGRGTLAPLCRPRAVARPCSRRRWVTTPRHAHAHAHAHADAAGAGSQPISRHAAAEVPDRNRPSTASLASLGHAFCGGERRPECADDHCPLAGLHEPAAPGSLAPRRCHFPHPYPLAIPPKHREQSHCVLPRSRRLAILLRHPSSASCHPGTDPPAASHRGHGHPLPLAARRKPTLLRP